MSVSRLPGVSDSRCQEMHLRYLERRRFATSMTVETTVEIRAAKPTTTQYRSGDARLTTFSRAVEVASSPLLSAQIMRLRRRPGDASSRDQSARPEGAHLSPVCVRRGIFTLHSWGKRAWLSAQACRPPGAEQTILLWLRISGTLEGLRSTRP